MPLESSSASFYLQDPPYPFSQIHSDPNDFNHIRQTSPENERLRSNPGYNYHIRGVSLRNECIPSNSSGPSAAQPPTPTTLPQAKYCSVCAAIPGTSADTETLPPLLNHERSVDSILHECHGGRTLHYPTFQSLPSGVPGKAHVALLYYMR